MDSHIVRYYGFLLAEATRIEAMKADSQAAAAKGEEPIHSGEDFRAQAFHIDNLAREV